MAQFKSKHTGAKIDEGVDKAFAAVPLIHDANGVRTLRDVAQNYFADWIDTSVKISIPESKTNVMMEIKITGYDYLSGGAFELILGGTDGAGDTWLNTSAILVSKSKFISKVRFARDGQKNCILLDFSNAHPYLSINLQSVTLSRTPYAIPRDDWNTSLIPNESGITNVVETPVNWVVTDDGVWYDMVLLNGATAQPSGGETSPLYRKVGNMVYLTGGISAPTGNETIVATLPTGFRPKRHFGKVMPVGLYSGPFEGSRSMNITPNGDIMFYSSTSEYSTYSFDIGCSFLTV